MVRNWIRKYKDLLLYLFFGGLVTVVNYLVYLPLYNLAHWPASVSNGVAWVVAVAFAFVTNKPFVFRSYDWSLKTVIPELWRFTLCRVGSGALETGLLFVLVDCLSFGGNLTKLLLSVMVILLNYFGSKYLVFRKANG